MFFNFYSYICFLNAIHEKKVLVIDKDPAIIDVIAFMQGN